MREVERQVMLQIIDQRWREHLYEMDYLQEGINLRAMGQKDPLVEWQREGFEMFGQMMHGIAQDFVRTSCTSRSCQQDRPRRRRPSQNVQYSRARGRRPRRATAMRRPRSPAPRSSRRRRRRRRAARNAATKQPRRQGEWDKTPRNAPCPCGSGKKFKLCHGQAEAHADA